MDDIKIKACSPDNAVQLAQLVGVFRDSYGDQFPFSGVYDAEYWARNIGARFTSVVASRRNRVLAHLAARPESRDSRVVQLCFPACSEEIRESAVEATAAAWELFSSVAARQLWSAIYYAAFSDIELMQRVGVEALQVSTTAILPAYIPLQNPRCARSDGKGSRDGARSHVIVGQRMLEHATPSLAPLYIPKQHLEMSKYLFGVLGISGISARLDRLDADNAAAMQADAPAVQSRVFKDWGAAHFVVRPSLLAGYQESLFEISRIEGAHSFIFVDARDAKCPQYCDFLEENAYLFSGILPNLFGTESLVYTRSGETPIDADALVCPVAQKLARYMNQQDINRGSLAHSLAVGDGSKYVSART